MKEGRLLDYLKHKDGSPFSEETVTNWYKGRAYVLEKLKDVAIGPASNERLRVVVRGDTPLMLSVVRHVAMSAHYANYDEENPEKEKRKRTVITLESNRNDIVKELHNEAYLGNLLDYCKYTIGGVVTNPDSYIDIELEILESWNGAGEKSIEMSEEDVNETLASKTDEEIYCIDTRKAVLADRMYDLGKLIDNLPFEDIHCAERYALALDVFQHGKLEEPMEYLVDDVKKWESNLTSVKEKLSNVFCADCFESRKKGMDEYIKNEKVGEKEAWEKHNEALSRSEHARWVVEKLIMGYRPLSPEEHVEDEEKFGSTKKQYRKKLKNDSKDPTHIDLCSYADLRRVNPDDLKYDSFLMLAIPKILQKLGIK